MKAELIDFMGDDLKTCQGCCIEKEEKHFSSRADRSGRLRPYCKECGKNSARARYGHHRRANPFGHKCTRTKRRAKSVGVPFDLTPSYLESIWTGFCPIYKKKITLTGKRTDEFTAELDRVVPIEGYVVGNVCFLSRRANRQKSNFTLEEMKTMVVWMEKFNREVS